MLCVIAGVLLVVAVGFAGEPLHGLLERIDPGLSQKIIVEIAPDSVDYFELSQRGYKPVVRGNNRVSVAVGINHYLKYTAGVHLGWNRMAVRMPSVLPPVKGVERRSTGMPMRYYLNYCTHSYSMAFWDWERWQREIDWAVLHGLNMPLAITGTDAVWRNMLRRMGYPDDRIAGFIAGPGFQAWWLMNNLQGWGGPNDDTYYDRQIAMQQKILERMRSLDMKPVLPGYSGMMPHDAGMYFGLRVADTGEWLGFTRPSFLLPTDTEFPRIAAMYYEEQERLFGKVPFYSMDPFHEGGNIDGVDLKASGTAIHEAMKRHNPDAAWVVQAWHDNPRASMVGHLPQGDVVVLDLQSENSPQWNRRPDIFDAHSWLYCMLLNFGGNVGLYGKMPAVTGGFAAARDSSRCLRGVGLTMEGIENNPVMYELLCELPWREGTVDVEDWIRGYAMARYGAIDDSVARAWTLLARSVYGCPADSVQQGTVESLFCARPSDNPRQVSTWASSVDYYDSSDVYEAARLMAGVANVYADNPNFVYDLVDVTRQAVADKGREVASEFSVAAARGDSVAYRAASRKFLRLMDLQDRLLGTLPDFRLGRWIEMARACGDTSEEKDRYEWNARVQITVWGTREAADGGGLHDYAHREWQGLLRDFYRPRWERWFDARLSDWGTTSPEIDFYEMEREWTLRHGGYSSTPEGAPVTIVREIIDEIISPCSD